MKNTKSSGNLFRKRGFFIALYSCLGIVAVLAMVITIANRQQSYRDTDTAYEQDAAQVGANQVDSYLAGFDEEAWFRPRQTEPPEPPPNQQQTVPPQRALPPVEPPPESIPETPPPTQPPTPPPTVPDTAPQAEAPPLLPQRTITFEPFTDYNRMSWPLYGETVMPFSITALIYDPTLDQFRTNDNIRIAAEEGTPVRAGADGIITAIGQNARQGNYVTIDHGNGWVATYAQLMEEVLVIMGQIVRAGDIIGGVGQPSIFGSAHGTHLHLRIEQYDMAVNPYYVLAQRSDRE